MVVTLFDYEVSRGYQTKMVTAHRSIIKKSSESIAFLRGQRLLEAGQRAGQPLPLLPPPRSPSPPLAAPPPLAAAHL